MKKTGKANGGLARALGGYLLDKRRAAGVFLLFAAIFALVFHLYDLQEEAVLYALGLCLLAGLLLLLAGFAKEWGRARERERMLAQIELLPEALPGPRTMAEGDYQAMALALRRMNLDLRSEWRRESRQRLDYFTAWMHQIKTPLAAMQMLLEEDTAQTRALLMEVFRVEQYADMALSYLRLGEEASSDLVIKNYALDPILRRAVRRYAPQFVHKRIRLVYEPVDCEVLTDEKWLGFIIEQLLSNAVKYTDGGSVTISLSADKVLSIADTGIGIAKEDLPLIFDKGFTGYNGRANRKSTGLGLYLCRRAADRLSHRLSARSEPGRGSVFSIDLSRESFDIE